MEDLGKIISTLRKEKGFTQEDLAELSKVNLRTIQRVENNHSTPRGKTLALIAKALETDSDNLMLKEKKHSNIKLVTMIINGFYLVLLNATLFTIIGYMTLPSEANINSRLGAGLLSFFIPFFIVYFTKSMSGIERMLKFGSGFVFYIVFLFIVQGFSEGMQTGLGSRIFLCIVIFFGVLYYGSLLMKNKS